METSPNWTPPVTSIFGALADARSGPAAVTLDNALAELVDESDSTLSQIQYVW